MLLWGAGDGIISGAAALLVAMSAHAWLSTPRLRWIERAAVAAAVASAFAPPIVGVAAGGVLVVPALRAAWIRAPERRAVRRATRVPRDWSAALMWSELAVLWRRQRPLAVRASLFIAGGAGVAALAIHNNRFTDPATISAVNMGVLAVTVAAALAAVAGGALAAEVEAAGYVEALGISARKRGVATGLFLFAAGALAGAAQGGLVAGLLRTDVLLCVRLVATGAACGAGIVSLLGVALRQLPRPRPRARRPTGSRARADGTTILLMLPVAGPVVVAATIGDVGAVAICAIGVAAVLIPPPRSFATEAVVVAGATEEET